MNPLTNQPEDTANYNNPALTELAWAIEASTGEFSLTLAHCNYTSLQEQLIQRLQKLCRTRIITIRLPENTTTLFTTLQTELQGETPTALMVLGLESVRDLRQVLSSANKVREEFRKKFPFPLILWVNDRALEQLIQWAPDLKSWTTTTEVGVTIDMLLEGIQQGTDDLFARLLDPQAKKTLPNIEVRRWEAHAAWQELQSWGRTLEPTLEASMNFVFGREADDQAKHSFEVGQEISASRSIEAARRFYQKSLDFWQHTGNLERQGVLLFHLGRSYYRQAEYYQVKRRAKETQDQEQIWTYWEAAKRYYQQCLIVLEQAHRLDLMAEHIGSLGNVLQHQEAWQALQELIEKNLPLHQTYQNFEFLAQDYCFLANTALHQGHWQDTKFKAQQALEVVQADGQEPQKGRQYQQALLLLAQADQHLEQILDAIAELEKARNIGEKVRKMGIDAPQLDLQILELLHSLYLQQKLYLKAFQIKHEQYSIEQQYGLRAFIGPGRLKSQRQAYLLAPEAGQAATIAQEILASGRHQNVIELTHRLEDHRYKLTILYGQSGVGKSSAIEAGLVPALKQKTTRGLIFLPVLIRKYTRWIDELGYHLAEAIREIGTPDIKLQTLEDIQEQLKQNEQHHLLTVLIFDQFEEFFFTCRNPLEHRKFFTFLEQCLNLSEVKVILSLREDYLYLLLHYQRTPKNNFRLTLLSNILDENNLYYIGNLAPEDTQALIHALTQRSHAFQSELVDALVNDLAGDTGEIRPIELQLVGTQLEAERITTLAQYIEHGPKEKFVQHYLDSVITACGKENQQAAELALYFLTGENNTRPIKTETQLETEVSTIAQDISREAHKLNLVLEIFVESGLVVLWRESSDNRYQLVHDYLAAFIRQQQENKHRELAAAFEQEKKRRTNAQFRLRLSRVLVITLSITALLGVVYALLRSQARTLEEMQITAQAGSLLVEAGYDLNALVYGLKTLDKLNSFDDLSVLQQPPFYRYKQEKIGLMLASEKTLQKVVYKIQERNQWIAHQNAIRSIDFSPDAQIIATASDDKTVQLWDHNGKYLQTLQGHTAPVLSASFSPDGKRIATASEDTTAQIWNLEGNGWKVVARLKGHQGRVVKVTFSQDSKWIGTASEDKSAKLWKQDGTLYKTLLGHTDQVTGISFSSDGQTIATASEDKTIKLWDIKGNLKQTLTGHQGGIWDIHFSPDGTMLASVGLDRLIKLWSTDGKLLSTTPSDHAATITTVRFSPDSKLLVTASTDHTVKLWSRNGNNLQYFQTLIGHQDTVWCSSFSPNWSTGANTGNNMLATASADGTVKLWMFNPYMIVGHHDRINSIRFSPDQQFFATASFDKTIKLWNRKGEYLRTLSGHTDVVQEVSFSPDSQTIASASWDNTVKLWTREGRQLKTLKGHTNEVMSVSFSPDEQTIATASTDRTVKLWTRDGTERKTLRGHTAEVVKVRFSPNGQIIATASWDNTAKLWTLDGQDRTLRGHENRVVDVAFSPDGQTVATASIDRTVKLWKLDGTLMTTFPRRESALTAISFSPDGQTLAAASRDRMITLWHQDAQQHWEQEGKLYSSNNPVTSFDFSIDGYLSKNSQVLAYTDDLGKIVLWHWNWTIEDLKESSCNWVQEYLKNSNSDIAKSDRNLCDRLLNPRAKV